MQANICYWHLVQVQYFTHVSYGNLVLVWITRRNICSILICTYFWRNLCFQCIWTLCNNMVQSLLVICNTFNCNQTVCLTCQIHMNKIGQRVSYIQTSYFLVEALSKLSSEKNLKKIISNSQLWFNFKQIAIKMAADHM